MAGWIALSFSILPVQAGILYGTSDGLNLSDSRSVSGYQQIVAPALVSGTNQYGNLTLAWSIQQNLNQTWNYSYTFTGYNSPDISHFILELSDVCKTMSTCVTDATRTVNASVSPISATNLSLATYTSGSSNPGLPVGTSIFGVKFDVGGPSPITYSFTSTQAPVWGNFYIKGGSGNNENAGVAYNFALGQGIDAKTYATIQNQYQNWFVARPDSISMLLVPVPEPGTIGLTGLGLLAAAFYAQRKRSKS